MQAGKLKAAERTEQTFQLGLASWRKSSQTRGSNGSMAEYTVIPPAMMSYCYSNAYLVIFPLDWEDVEMASMIYSKNLITNQQLSAPLWKWQEKAQKAIRLK